MERVIFIREGGYSGYLMSNGWDRLAQAFKRIVPEGSALSKVVLVLGIVLLFEGISVLLLFSYDAAYLGLISIIVGALLAFLAYPRGAPEPTAGPEAPPEEEYTIGVRLIEGLIARLGGDYVLITLGIMTIVLVLVFNIFFSSRSEIGDLDTLMMMFGGMMVIYPFLANKFLVESAFSLTFLGIVVVLLVLPQAVMSIHSGVGTSAGNWYVHYMLAAPFSGLLNLLGIPSHSTGNSVTLPVFDPATGGEIVQTLGISAYCAGLYSFSIFVSAFMSFILVFERMRLKPMLGVLGLGLLIAYLGNLFRMVIIGVVGHAYGVDALLWTHRNVGWMIFLGWSAVFWFLIIRYVTPRAKKKGAMQNHT